MAPSNTSKLEALYASPKASSLSISKKIGGLSLTGTIRSKKGKWYLVFQYNDDTGKRRQSWEATGLDEKGNKRKAQELLKKRMDELGELTPQKAEGKHLLFLTEMETWLDKVLCFDVRPNTLTQYKSVFQYHIKSFLGFQGVKLSQVKPITIQEYYNAKLKSGLSGETIRKHHANFHKFFDYCLRLELIDFNPTDRIVLPKKQKCTVGATYSIEQLKKLFEVMSGEVLEPVVFIAAQFGLRRSEVAGLRWQDVDFERRSIHIRHTVVMDNGKPIYVDNTKSETSNRLLPMSETVYQFLFKLHRESMEKKKLLFPLLLQEKSNGVPQPFEYVCCYESGSPIKPHYITRHFADLLRKNDLPKIRFHDLRHTTATLLRQCGYDLRDIQLWLGHASMETTTRYAHFLEESKVDMANSLEKLGKAKKKNIRNLSR